LKVSAGELDENEKAFLFNFLHLHLKFGVTASHDGFFVESEKLSSQELERLVNKFVYHQNLNHKYWVSLEKDVVKINRLKGIKRHMRTNKAFHIILWAIMLIISLSSVTVLVSIFLKGSPSQNLVSLVSLDWGGYVVFSDFANPQPVVVGVSGSWTVPTVTVSQQDKFSAAWIGIGGQVDETLIQTGTEHDSIDGNIIYSAWYELLPNDSIEIPTINVYPGDRITASIRLLDSTTSEWSIEIDDVTQGEGFKQSFLYDSSRLSAEWIVERPTVNNTLSTLAEFGSITFTDSSLTMSTNAGTISDFPFAQVVIHDRQNRELVTVSSLASNGASFTVDYLSNIGSIKVQDMQIAVRTTSNTKDVLSKPSLNRLKDLSE
jgi:hypothetical protein